MAGKGCWGILVDQERHEFLRKKMNEETKEEIKGILRKGDEMLANSPSFRRLNYSWIPESDEGSTPPKIHRKCSHCSRTEQSVSPQTQLKTVNIFLSSFSHW